MISFVIGIIGDPCDKDVDCSAAVFRSLCNESCVCEEGYDANPVTNFATCVKCDYTF